MSDDEDELAALRATRDRRLNGGSSSHFVEDGKDPRDAQRSAKGSVSEPLCNPTVNQMHSLLPSLSNLPLCSSIVCCPAVSACPPFTSMIVP